MIEHPGDKKEKCGVFGIFHHEDAANIAYLGLYALQHRGQESGGIASSDRNHIYLHRGMGLVADIFPESVLRNLKGDSAIGHVRYSTAGSSYFANAQPIKIICHKGEIAVAHNGNLVNAATLKDRLDRSGSIFQGNSDTEVILHLIARSPQKNVMDAIVDALSQVRGAYSLLFMTKDSLIAARDPFGFRPLLIGKLGDSVVVASETTAFDLIGATWEREIEPGEVVRISETGVECFKPFPPQPHQFCVFELIYFARPDSVIFGHTVRDVRVRLGEVLAREHPTDADIVVPVPDGGVFAAMGYSRISGKPFEIALIRNHYVGRTFIEPRSRIRHFGVKIKLNPIKTLIKGKSVALIDDSIVRSTTSQKIVEMVRNAGAREVHYRVSSPPYISPCYYGIDTPKKDQLAAAVHTIEEIRQFIGADTLGYLSIEGMLSAVGNNRNEFCKSCFTTKYPVDYPDEEERQLALFDKGDEESPGDGMPV
jgi:amidophosphoribosyltransferase